jgi:hypothetical protein
MSQNNVHPIRITNIGDSLLQFKLSNGTGSPENFDILPGGYRELEYEPDANGCIGFKVKQNANHKNPLFKLVIGENKTDCDLDMTGNSNNFKLKILVPQMKTIGDTSVEVGVDEPPTDQKQKQKTKGK